MGQLSWTTVLWLGAMGVQVTNLSCRSLSLHRFSVIEATPPDQLHQQLSSDFGPVRLADFDKSLAAYPEVRQMRLAYRQLVPAALPMDTASSVAPYQYDILRNQLFLPTRPVLGTSQTSAALLQLPPGRFGEQRRSNPRLTLASAYAHRVLSALLSAPIVPWAASYSVMPHVQSRKRAQLQDFGFSRVFDRDIMLSLHAEVSNDSHLEHFETSCGGVGRFRSCDGHHYSPFFHPLFRPLPCQKSRVWRPDPQTWSWLLSAELRSEGAHVLPVRAPGLLNSFLPVEYAPIFPGASCSAAIVQEYEFEKRFGLAAREADWLTLKSSIPDYSRQAIDFLRGSKSFKNTPPNLNELGAFTVSASVEQIGKEIMNYKLNERHLHSGAECDACRSWSLLDHQRLFVWDMEQRSVCPAKCLSNDRRVPGRAGPKEQGIVYDPYTLHLAWDGQDPSFPALIPMLRDHFLAMRNQKTLPRDPIWLAAYVYRKILLLRPFEMHNEEMAWLLAELVLHSVGLPLPLVSARSDDPIYQRLADTERIFRQGIKSHLSVVAACQNFLACVQETSGQPLQCQHGAPLHAENADACRYHLDSMDASFLQARSLRPCQCWPSALSEGLNFQAKPKSL